MNDVIEYIDGQWFFWDETWTYTYGPYESYDEAVREYRRYITESTW